MSDLPHDPSHDHDGHDHDDHDGHDHGASGDAGQAGEPTEEELRAYLAELRSADLSDLIAQVQSMLLNAVQVKLGRNDARVLLDLVANVNEQVKDHVDPELPTQVAGALAQLRLAQVEAEQEAQRLRAAGQLPDVEPGDIVGNAAPGNGAATPPPAAQPAAGRLWTPGT